jgi:hypothetical protein
MDKNELGGTCCTNGKGEMAYKTSIEKPQGKEKIRTFRRRHKWDNINMDLIETGF